MSNLRERVDKILQKYADSAISAQCMKEVDDCFENATRNGEQLCMRLDSKDKTIVDRNRELLCNCCGKDITYEEELERSGLCKECI